MAVMWALHSPHSLQYSHQHTAPQLAGHCLPSPNKQQKIENYFRTILELKLDSSQQSGYCVKSGVNSGISLGFGSCKGYGSISGFGWAPLHLFLAPAAPAQFRHWLHPWLLLYLWFGSDCDFSLCTNLSQSFPTFFILAQVGLAILDTL